MKWYFLVMLMSIGYDGPFDSEAECLKALTDNKPTVIDPGFYNPPLVAFGLCFQASPASWNKGPR